MSSIFDNPRLLSSFEWIGDKIPGGFFVYRADGNLEILYANKSVLRIFGCADMKEFTELTGNTFNGLVHPDDLGEVLDSIEEQISDESGDKMDYVEYRIIRRDGSVRWVDDYGHFAQLEGYGDVFYVFISDITEKYNEKKENIRRSNVYTGLSECFLSPLRKCLASCRANLSTGLIDIVKGDDLYDTDYEGGLFEDYLASRLDSFLNDDDREAFKVLFNADNLTDRFYKGGGRSSFVAYCRRNSGIQCFVKFSAAVAIEPESGERIIFCRETEYNDEKVSEVLNEKVLVKQYDMVTYIVNDNYSVVIGDISKNRKGSICPVRKSGIYTDYIKNQVIPAVSESVHIKSELEEALSPLTVARELEKSDSYNLDVTCDIDGEIYIKRFSFYAVNKEMNFYLLLKSDVTDVLRKERRQNELLAYALSEAEHANAAKTAFLSNMSHEIRTPMNAIIGLNTIALKDDTISEQTRDYLKKIGESANHLLVLINDILDMSRIESGRFTLSKEDFSFSSLISRINAMVQSQCADKGLNYECALNGDLNEWYYGDDSKLRQVLLNILSNAVKFTNAPGKVTLSVEKVSEFDKHSTLRFIICDTGIGMNPDFLPKIFDTFTQENAGKDNKYGSTGLGMAITKNIVEAMNGTISVQSEKGVGSQFTVTVTLRSGKKPGGADASFDFGRLRALVIDDDPISLRYAEMVMDEVGIPADTCISGSEAITKIELQKAKNDPYSFVLIDWKMPDCDGLEVTRRIRNRFGNDIAVVILTAYTWDDIRDEALEAGVDKFISKPVNANKVKSVFEQILQLKKQEDKSHRHVDLDGRRVLLVEDMIINAEIMKQLLSMKGIEVDHAENGQIAVDKFSQSSEDYYDAVLMDIRMPVMDGLEATAAIRALDRKDSKRVCIIALTANAFDEDVQKSLQAGMNAHLTKPVEPEYLYQTLSELIYETKRGIFLWQS